MNNLKAVLTAIVLAAGGATSCAAADMPMRDEPMAERPPLRLQYAERYAERDVEPVGRRRIVCNAVGRCFRIGRPVPFFDGREPYPGPRAFGPPVYGVPDYAVRRPFRAPRFADRDFDERGFRGDRRFGEPGFDAPPDRYRRSFEDRRAFEDDRGGEARPQQRWSREDRRFDERSGEPD